jgi:hypothetical protein
MYFFVFLFVYMKSGLDLIRLFFNIFFKEAGRIVLRPIRTQYTTQIPNLHNEPKAPMFG